ncbi:lariat debranching enzyme [Coemansia pectinata]|uniref:Lariat debranching enzyme n=1 Tax=Coemansia pectinata TaxID=1052879 RepID=A0A9W8GV25_9FUNG|nr:lariat debranching enzyme [Coemansia pectinata]
MHRRLTIAVEGCCHGQLDDIYRHLQQQQQRLNKTVDLLIICGDFQAVRNVADLETMSCPNKYKQVGGFYRYYTGERKAPIPTVFVGGNHEASNHMRELYYGGWVAPNIYYVGGSGVVKFGGLRIGGITGIFKDFDYAKGYYETPPFRGPGRASMHHVRSYEAFKMLQIRRPLDIVVSHDWPQYIERYGNTAELLRKKPFFEAEVNRGDLGSPVNALLLERLRPAWWFSAHMHVRFQAEVGSHESIFNEGWAGIPPYSSQRSESMCGSAAVADKPIAAANQDEIVMSALSDDDEDNSTTCEPPSRPRLALNLPPPKHSAVVEPSTESAVCDIANAEPDMTPKKVEVTAAETDTRPSNDSSLEQEVPEAADPKVPGRPTRFLALDKCLPRRQFLEIIEIEVPEGIPGEHPQLEYDAEWLAILRLCHPHMPLSELPFSPPAEAQLSEAASGIPLLPEAVLTREMDWVHSNVFNGGDRMFIPPNFMPMAPTPPPGTPDSASFGLAAQGADMWNRGRGRGRGNGRGRGRGGYAQTGQHSDVEWVGPRPYVIYPNPQTDELCKLLGIEDKLTQRRY